MNYTMRFRIYCFTFSVFAGVGFYTIYLFFTLDCLQSAISPLPAYTAPGNVLTSVVM